MKAKLNDALLPCPFCGGKARVYYAQANDDAGIPCYGVSCEACKIMIGTTRDGVTDFFRTAVEAANAWNNRRYVIPVKITIKEKQNENS